MGYKIMFDTMMRRCYKGAKITNGGDLCLPVPTAERNLSNSEIGDQKSIIVPQNASIRIGLKQNVFGVKVKCPSEGIYSGQGVTALPHAGIRHIGNGRKIGHCPSP